MICPVYNYGEKPTVPHIPYNIPPFLTIHCSIGQSDSLKTFPCFTPSPASFWSLYFINMFLHQVQYTTLDDYLWCFPCKCIFIVEKKKSIKIYFLYFQMEMKIQEMNLICIFFYNCSRLFTAFWPVRSMICYIGII